MSPSREQISANSSTAKILEFTSEESIPNEEIKEAEIKTGEVCGIGTYATVYKAKWKEKEVAVKKIDCEHPESTLESCENENEIMKRLSSHSHFLAYYGFYKATDLSTYNIVMEYFNSKELRNYILNSSNNTASWEVRIEIMRQIVDALVCMHDLDIIHGDLKPENILIDKSLKIKICDFSFSKYAREKVVYRGTPEYMAPELLDKTITQVSDKIDIYALAIILWELAALLSYSSKNGAEICKATRAGHRNKIDQRWPAEVQSAIEESWHQYPEKRPKAEELSKRFCPR